MALDMETVEALMRRRFPTVSRDRDGDLKAQLDHQGGRARVPLGCRRCWGTGVDRAPLASPVLRHCRGDPGVVHGAGARP